MKLMASRIPLLFLLFPILSVANEKLETLDNMAHLVRLHLDGIRLCKISQKNAIQMSQHIKAKLDMEIRKTARELEKNKSKHSIYAAKLDRCEKRCHCGVYADLFEAVKDSQKTTVAFRKLASKLSTAQVKRCVQDKQALCANLLKLK